MVSFYSTAFGQEVEQYVKFGPAPDWVEVVERPTLDSRQANGSGVNYLLVDRQRKYSNQSADHFVHYVDQLITPSAVEENSTVSVEFDPAYETVTFHRLLKIRDGTGTDILDPSRFELYRVESDREKLIYNGTLQLSYVIPDVRTGDILDYSYTIHGKNPALGTHFTGGFQHAYSVAVQRHFNRFLVPSHAEVRVKSFGGADTGEVTKFGEFTAYTWDRREVPSVDIDDNIPPGHFAVPLTLFTTYESWKTVGRYFANYYEVGEATSKQLSEIASGIRSRHQTSQARLRAALDFVQREVRYLGIELGQGGYIPRQPGEVLATRFGDCKDMSLLLIAILDQLDIEAVPLLVSLENTDAVDALVPSHGAFDHVIVMAFLGGKKYYLDPTRGVQLGDLDYLQQGDFGKGVIISHDSPGMITTKVPLPVFFKDITDTYDVVTEPGAVLLTSVSKYRMGHADNMLAWYVREGAAAADKSFLQYYQHLHPQIEQAKPLEVDVDEPGGAVTITGTYRIPGAWQNTAEQNIKEFYVRADDALQDMPAYVGISRTTPYDLPHPVRTRQTLRFILDDTWAIEESETFVNQRAFSFSDIERFSNNIYTKTITYRSNLNEIAAEDFRESMSAIQEARTLVGVTLTIDEGPLSGSIASWLAEIENLETKVVLWQIAAILVVALFALLQVRNDSEWFGTQVFYPVSVAKFAVLTTVSLGVYPIFWTYMNWRWARNVDSENVSPGWRAFFMVLTNFSLFARMSQKSGGFGWFRIAGAPLAVVILVGAVADRYYAKHPDAPEWLFLFGMACMLAWLPAVVQVNKLNENQPHCQHKNSSFGWPALGFIAIFAPTFALVAYRYL